MENTKSIKIIIAILALLIIGIVGFIGCENSESDNINQTEIISEVNKSISNVISEDSYKQLSEQERVDLLQKTLEQLAKDKLVKKNSICYDKRSKTFSFEYGSGGIGIIDMEKKPKFNIDDIDSNIFKQRELKIDIFQNSNTSILQLSNSNIQNKLNAVIIYGWDKWDDNNEKCIYYSGTVRNYFEEKGFNITIQKDATISDYKNKLQNNDLIIFATHGTTTLIKTGRLFKEELYCVLTLSEEVTDYKNDTIYKEDIEEKRIAIRTEEESGIIKYVILPSFFDFYYQNNELENSFVYMQNCKGFGYDQIYDYRFSFALTNAGTEIVVGFHNDVAIGYSMAILSQMTERLLVGDTYEQALVYAKEQVGYDDRSYAMRREDYREGDVFGYPILAGYGERKFINDFSDNKQDTIETNTEEETENITTTETEEFLTATDNDFNELTNMLDTLYDLKGFEFDYITTSAKSVLKNMVYNIHGYHYYYDYDFNEIKRLEIDPLMKFERNYDIISFPDKNVDWIIQNIFNLEPDHSINDDWIYYKDGYYYFMSGAVGYTGHSVVIRDKTKLSDGKYSVICDFYSIEYDNYINDWVKGNELYGTTRMTVALKEIDGKKYWSFYQIEHIYELETIILGDWTNGGTGFSDKYITTFNPDGTVIVKGWRNLDKGTYIIENNSVIANFTDCQITLPAVDGDSGGWQKNGDGYSCTYIYDRNTKQLNREFSGYIDSNDTSEPLIKY